MKSYRLCCNAFQCVVTADDARVIVRADKIGRKFLGRPVDALTEWMRKYGTVDIEVEPVTESLFDTEAQSHRELIK